MKESNKNYLKESKKKIFEGKQQKVFEGKQKIFEWILKDSKNIWRKIKKMQESKKLSSKANLFEGKQSHF